MSISLESKGRRHYLTGNTYHLRDDLRAEGFKWDADMRAWWTGNAEKARKFVEDTPQPAEKAPERVSDSARVLRARVEVGTEKLYAVSTPTNCKDGTWRTKVCKRDGTGVRWVESSAVHTLRTYKEPQSIGGLREFAEQKGREEVNGVPTKQCWECGRAFTQLGAKDHGGDWAESYCGC